MIKFIIIIAVAVIAIRLSRNGSGRKRTYTTPGGKTWDLFTDALAQPHLLIAGTTGSGKSVIINGLIDTLMHRLPFDQPGNAQLILIDPKRVELSQYKDIPHTVRYASEPAEMLAALQAAMAITEKRFKAMQRKGEKLYTGGDLYVVIDEWADLMTTQKKAVMPIVQRLAQVGRAARVHIILATQTPLATILPTEIKCNFDARFCLRTMNASQSRVIMDANGCESLPRFGSGFFVTPASSKLYSIPYVQPEEIKRNLDWWDRQRRAA